MSPVQRDASLWKAECKEHLAAAKLFTVSRHWLQHREVSGLGKGVHWKVPNVGSSGPREKRALKKTCVHSSFIHTCLICVCAQCPMIRCPHTCETWNVRVPWYVVHVAPCTVRTCTTCTGTVHTTVTIHTHTALPVPITITNYQLPTPTLKDHNLD